jgi:CheY-like chemotaxis protein
MPTILLIEDDQAILLLFTMALEDRYTILAANNGRDGLRLFEQNHVDLIITDLSMSGFDGFDVIRAVRAIGRPVKIVAHSALINQGNVKQLALDAGADVCLAKPVPLPVMEQTVADLLASGGS